MPNLGFWGNLGFSHGSCCYCWHGRDVHRSTTEHVPTTIFGAAIRGNDFFHFLVKYMWNGHELEHHAPLDCDNIYT